MQEHWLEKVELACQQAFAGSHIPSHDFAHHQRVWNYASEIARSLDASFSDKGDNDYLNLLTACYFHDTGLTVNSGEDHGADSLQLLVQWLEKVPEMKSAIGQPAFDAVRLHDDKSYKQQSSAPLSADNTLAILCLADDMDALGYLGILRYTEIYLMRGISADEIPCKVIANLESRFRFMAESIKGLPAIYKHHRQRYEIAHRFFTNWQRQGENIAEYATFAALVQTIVVEQKQGWDLLAKALTNQSWQELAPVIDKLVAEIK